MNSVVAFDIETIPDVQLCQSLTGFSGSNVMAQRKAMEDYHLQITDGKNSFLRQPFHKVIVISLLKATLTTKNGYDFLELKKISSGDLQRYTEKELVQFFFDHVCTGLPRLVSFNGKTFDIPVLKYRAMKYDITAEKFYKAGDKWSNYNSKYGTDWHVDLIDVVSDYGASARVKMNEVCVALGLPGKCGIDGKDIATMYDAGKIAEIRNYCETDVLNTYLIYQKVMHHKGSFTKESYKKNIDDVIRYLTENAQEKHHYDEFLAQWQKSCGGQFYS